VKHIFAYILILAFGFLIIPRDTWHDCHAKDELSHNSKAQFSEKQADCDICHIQLFQWDTPELTITYSFNASKILSVDYPVQHSTIFYARSLNKGPPTC
jgi:hypothetical protein